MSQPKKLHYNTQYNQPYGSESRMCSKCGIRLWIASDGTWTASLSIWEAPPDGWVNCANKEGSSKGL